MSRLLSIFEMMSLKLGPFFLPQCSGKNWSGPLQLHPDCPMIRSFFSCSATTRQQHKTRKYQLFHWICLLHWIVLAPCSSAFFTVTDNWLHEQDDRSCSHLRGCHRQEGCPQYSSRRGSRLLTAMTHSPRPLQQSLQIALISSASWWNSKRTDDATWKEIVWIFHSCSRFIHQFHCHSSMNFSLYHWKSFSDCINVSRSIRVTSNSSDVATKTKFRTSSSGSIIETSMISINHFNHFNSFTSSLKSYSWWILTLFTDVLVIWPVRWFLTDVVYFMTLTFSFLNISMTILHQDSSSLIPTCITSPHFISSHKSQSNFMWFVFLFLRGFLFIL